MKLFLLSIVFFLSASIHHTSSNEPINYGHCPVAQNHSFDAVIPVINRTIKTTEMRVRNNSAGLYEKEMFYAAITGLVALSPHYIIGYY